MDKNRDYKSSLSTRKRKKTDIKPFDRFRTPPKQNLFLMPLIWLLCFILTRKGKLKIKRERMKDLKPPFIVLGTHHAFSDFYVTPLALFPYRANYISELEGFEAFGEWIYRQVGCLGTRKFVNDIALIKNIKKVVDRKGVIVIYPEARYANVGTTALIPESVGKLVKMLGVPLVTINMRGNYLQSPIWNLSLRKDARQEAIISQVFTKEEVSKATVEEINFEIQKKLSFDEYSYQYEKKMKISFGKRAEGLHNVLYRCPECNFEFSTGSEGADIYCKKCGVRFTMNEYGRLIKDGSEWRFSHIPDWYEWQRECVKKEIDDGKYYFDGKVHIESLPNAVNFINLGTGRLVHNSSGYYLTFCDYEKQEETLYFSSASMLSVHTEYDYRNSGQCITLSTLDNTYFIFPECNGFNATKFQFATEYFFEISKKHENDLNKDSCNRRH